MKKIELLSPVGSFESLTAAIQGGADSVYFGVGQLNMRSRSCINFTLDDLKEISRVCKENHVKTYLTLNTVVFDDEFEEIKTIVDAAQANGIDAIIASDFAVIQYAFGKQMTVHISTQCNVTNTEALKFYSRFADVVVVARELPVEKLKILSENIEKQQIKGPSGELIRLEVFAHGALCMAISGKCYLSLHHYNQSANRGACYQLCRRAYIAKDKESDIELEIDNEYIMSPKDLCTIGFLDKLIQTGISILKIEGRGRSPDYVKTVTACYREALQSIENHTYSEEKIQHWMKRLSEVFNRGFWEGYYLGKTMGEWSQKYGSSATKQKVYIGKITNFFSKISVAEIKIETGDLHPGDEILIIGKTTGVYNDIVSEIRFDEEPHNKATKGSICSIPVSTRVHRGDKLYKLMTL